MQPHQTHFLVLVAFFVGSLEFSTYVIILYISKGSFTLSFQILMPLIFSPLHWIEAPVQCEIEFAGVDTLALFLVLGKNIQSFTMNDDVSDIFFSFFVDTLYQA